MLEIITALKNGKDVPNYHSAIFKFFENDFQYSYLFSLFEFIQDYLPAFSDSLDTIEQSDDPIETFIELFSPKNMNESVINAVWNSLLENLKVNEQFEGSSYDIFQIFYGTPIPKHIYDSILEDDNLIKKLLLDVEVLGPEGSSIEKLLNEIVTTKVDFINNYLAEKKGKIYENNPILKLVFDNFTIYSDFIEKYVKTNQNYISLFGYESFSEEVIMFVIKFVPGTNIEWFFHTLEVRYGINWIKKLLKHYLKDKSFKNLIMRYIPTTPNLWDTRIQASQERAFKMLKEMDIDMDEDEEN